MQDDEKVDAIRQAMPVTQQKAYFNAGSVGPISTNLRDVLSEANQEDLTAGRGTITSFKKSIETFRKLREAFARFVQASPSEIALTHNTTEGMNIVAQGLTWQPGDEVVTTNLEHEGGFLPLFVLRQRHGVAITVIEISENDAPEDIFAKFDYAITPRTRLLAFSHVAWNLGNRLPMAEIVTLGHRRGALSLVDGAQSAGAIELDLPASGVDFYAMPGQKWLCGPEGIGALYIRRDRLGKLALTYAGYWSLKDVESYDFSGYFVPAPGALRFEVSSVYRPAIKAMEAHMGWLSDIVGWDWIYERTAQLFDYAYQALGTVPGLHIITRPGPQAGLLCFNIEGFDPARVFSQLDSEGIVLRFIRHPYCLRISAGFYNNEADVDRLVSSLIQIVQRGPEALPEFEPPI